jgi:hypothetical protein
VMGGREERCGVYLAFPSPLSTFALSSRVRGLDRRPSGSESRRPIGGLAAYRPRTSFEAEVGARW